MTPSRWWHLLTALVATFALVLQLVLVWQGNSIPETDDPPALGERLIRFFGYFTILSNALVAYSSWTIAPGRDRDTTLWRLLRLDGLIGITVTFVVVQVLLKGLVELDGADLLADKLLHVVVPVLAVIGWLVFGPRLRVRRSDLLPALVFPVARLVYTLVRGEVVDWYPYPFLDAGSTATGRWRRPARSSRPSSSASRPRPGKGDERLTRTR
ncbi:Pr6Pr family membrane protein [Nocardioides sp. B-3]|uniref:Pr6Pr family membrane protein n=1 Tax=Nocardioides sp. B-3 TaxID=2895565 RepID=UPI0021521237|nr:Pr6Pr family membrane protein [Nocardioides sp. B-3]UUZ61354.1 Pr6Pr family membrane protein [Nocardioides sp. B-3]